MPAWDTWLEFYLKGKKSKCFLDDCQLDSMKHHNLWFPLYKWNSIIREVSEGGCFVFEKGSYCVTLLAWNTVCR